jgi:hypothetical protein
MKETFGMETMTSQVLPLLNSMMQVNGFATCAAH